MIEQLKTIRDNLGKFAAGYIDAGNKIVDALTQLEAMVGEQEPVAWQRRMKPVWGDRDYLWSPWEECSEGTAEDCWKTPLLHEWAYEARALYTAVPVDQRPRAKEIGEADLDPDEGDPVTLWAEIWRLREAVKGPDGYATWQDAATAERILRVRAENKQAAPVAQQYEAGDMASAAAQGFRDGVASVAQQPQARPDFPDEWTGYLKDGETPFERFLRERKDVQSVLKLYQRVLEENERLKAQQPQAEAVQCSVNSVSSRMCEKGTNGCDTQHAPQQAEAVAPGYVLVPVKPTDEMIDAACSAVDDLYRMDFLRAYTAAIAQQKGGGA